GKVATIPFEVELTLNRDVYTPKKHDFFSSEAKMVKGIGNPVLSPDGRQIAFSALGDLWLLKIGDPVPVKLTDDPFIDAHPCWSPDGKKLAYISDKAGNMDIWVVDP